MIIVHNSRSSLYRSPFGAAPAGSRVTLHLDVLETLDESIREVSVCYAFGMLSFEESYSVMQQIERRTDGGRYRISFLLPGDRGLFYYWFRVKSRSGQIYYGVPSENLDGSTVMTELPPHVDPAFEPTVRPFQITMYDPDFSAPEWFRGAVVYQIFPDRFARHKAFELKNMYEAKPVSERIYHDIWDEDVDYIGKPETGYLALDFYGGTLRGIIEKLQYLSSLHVEIIYLNPIFTARTNHRYDTADYRNVDPMLGTNQDFIELASKAEDLGMKIILDGVFNHTGADSKYFDRFARFNSAGAYQSFRSKENSNYISWYSLAETDEGEITYESWWGFDNLPEVNDAELSYREYILGEDGVVWTWLDRGAAGFRLDVSDELSDSFLRDLKRAVKRYKHDAVLIGEIWEDASNKFSYGHFRDFAFGLTHDSAMGYPFRNAVLRFLQGEIDAVRLDNELESIREHYPDPFFMSNMNLLSSHDVERFITAVSGKRNVTKRCEQSRIVLTGDERKRGSRLLKIAYAFLLTYPGCPCIYYGDEVGMEGYTDPFNRRTYPWGQEDRDLLETFRKITMWRGKYRVLREGTVGTIMAEEKLYVFRRQLPRDLRSQTDDCEPASALTLINASRDERVVRMNGSAYRLPAESACFACDGQIWYV